MVSQDLLIFKGMFLIASHPWSRKINFRLLKSVSPMVNFGLIAFQSLRTLIQGRQGVTWTLGTPMEVTELITGYTDELLDQGLVDKIIS